MIISHKHKFVFIHNPKVAGTSMRNFLMTYHDDPRRFWHQGWLPSEDRVIDLAHPTADLWSPMINQSYTVFGFVRHPYERFLSGLTEVLRRHEPDFQATENPTEFILKMLTPANLRWDWRFIHLCPQHYFFFLGNKCMVDKIGRLENLNQDWPAVKALLGLNFPAVPGDELPVNRKAATPPKRELLDNPLIVARINSLYLKDFQLFGYTMLGSVEAVTHSQRVAAIHDPSRSAIFSPEDYQKIPFTQGELTALKQTKV